MLRRSVVPAAVAALVLLVAPGAASAHTESDVVAVPTGSDAVVTLAPTHGCGDSPTVKVSTRVPVPEASGGDVDGWLMVATSEGFDRTVIEWTGGSLPADQEGAFPVTFTVPDTVGELVTFPFVQECADGSELAWISGDPDAEFPAPRVLVLAAGSEPATSIDDVPADAPGRDLLTEIVDVDGAGATTTTAVDPSTTEAIEDEPTHDTEADAETDEGDGTNLVVPIAVAVTVAAFGGWQLWRRSRSAA